MKLLIFPFSEEFIHFTMYPHLLHEFTDVIPIAIKGSGLEGTYSDIFINNLEQGYVVSSDFESALRVADAVFFGYQHNVKIDVYTRMIELVLVAKKRIYIEKDLFQMLPERFSYMDCDMLSFDEIPIVSGDSNKLYRIQIPVIFVASVGETCDKYLVQLGLKNNLEKNNYKVAQWGTKTYSSLFGINPLPKYLFDLHSARDKIISFNHHIYNRIAHEKADVAIIGIPGGIMRLNPLSFDDFGEYAFIIGNAITADTGVLCFYAIDINEELIDRTCAACLYRLNMKPRYINIASKSISLSLEKMKNELHNVPTSHIYDNIIPNVGKYINSSFCGRDYADMKKATEGIIEMLQQNI